MRAPLFALLAVVALAPAALVLAGGAAPQSSTDPEPGATAASRLELLAWGERLFALNCAVCHGASGGGLAEAKLAFPEDHRTCTRCHKPSNRVVQPLSAPFEDHDMFSIGDPPPLRDPSRSPDAAEVAEPATASRPDSADPADASVGLATVASPSVILAYVAATMPRYDPGRLTQDQYVAITAHLLKLNGRTDEVADLPPATMPAAGGDE